MRKIVIGLALATTAIAPSAMARDGQWYVGLDGGLSILEDADFDIGTTANAANQDHSNGYDFGGTVGYDFGGFRMEAETSYREADPKTLTSSIGLPVARGSFNDPRGDTNALSFMVNGLLDFGADDGIQGFVGAGIGVARVEVETGVSRASRFLNDSDTGLAWQALAGVRAPLSDSWDAGLKYRYFNGGDLDLVDTAGRAVSTSVTSHSLMGSLVYNFGGEAEPVYVAPPAPPPAPPPPPPMPPRPTPPPAPVCNKGPYIVFFDWDKSNITPEAASILDNAVAAYANCARVPIMLAGHADRSGNPTYNVGLSQRRNAAVTAYLTSRNIPGAAISGQAFGEGRNRVQTSDGVRELQNRRVEITYGPGSGM